MAIQKREQTIKKLLYQSCNRGCKETDLIIGEFAKENLGKMTDEEINLFSEILKPMWLSKFPFCFLFEISLKLLSIGCFDSKK